MGIAIAVVGWGKEEREREDQQPLIRMHVLFYSHTRACLPPSHHPHEASPFPPPPLPPPQQDTRTTPGCSSVCWTPTAITHFCWRLRWTMWGQCGRWRPRGGRWTRAMWVVGGGRREGVCLCCVWMDRYTHMEHRPPCSALIQPPPHNTSITSTQ